MNELIQPHRCPRSSPNPICVIWNLKYFLFSHGHSFGVEKTSQLFCYQSSLQISLFRVIPTVTNISTYIPTFNLTYIQAFYLLHIFWRSIWHLFRHYLASCLTLYLAVFLAFDLAFYLPYFLTLSDIANILSDVLSDIVSGILDGITVPDIFSDILYISGVPSYVLSDILSDIWCGIRFDSLSYILGHVVWQWVRVRQGPGGWGACNRM